MSLTLFDNMWQSHVAGLFCGRQALIAIDRNIVQETTCCLLRPWVWPNGKG